MEDFLQWGVFYLPVIPILIASIIVLTSNKKKHFLTDSGEIKNIGYVLLAILCCIYVGIFTDGPRLFDIIYIIPFILFFILIIKLINRFIKTLFNQTKVVWLLVLLGVLPPFLEFIAKLNNRHSDGLSYFLTIFIVFAILGYINKYIRGRSKSN